MVIGMEMGTHDTRGPIDKAAVTSKRVESVFDLPADMDPRAAALVNPTLAAVAQRRCIEGHDLCWMHEAAPGRSGVVEGPASRFGDDADRDSAKAARLAELVRDMDSLVEGFRDGRTSAEMMAAQGAHYWQAIRKLTQEGAAS